MRNFIPVLFGVLAWNAAYPNQRGIQDPPVSDKGAKCAYPFPFLFERIDVQNNTYYVHSELLDFFSESAFQQAAKKQNFSCLFPLAEKWIKQKFSTSGLNIFSLCTIVEGQTQVNQEQKTECPYCFQALSDILICALKETDHDLLRQCASDKETCSKIRNSSFKILFERNIPEWITQEERNHIAPFMPNDIVEHFRISIERARELSSKKFPNTKQIVAILEDMLDVRADVEGSWRKT